MKDDYSGWIEVGFAVIAVIKIAIIVGIIILTIHVVGEVQEYGLKGVIENIWEGSDN